MPESPNCPQCGAEIPPGTPAGLCPKCMLQAGFASRAGSDPKLEPTQPPRESHPGFVPPPVEELAARFPQLEILELLGKGGMGAVYKARQRGLDRLVAVKILPPEVKDDAGFAERFTREARALARLNHPNIVAVHDFGQVGGPAGAASAEAPVAGSQAASVAGDGLFYFIMEYVDGVNLRQAIQAGGMTPQQALVIVPQICDVLQFAHDEGIVHRDIKPENILIDKRGRAKIADFGLAKLLGHDQGDHGLTGTHQVMGTLRYMAPEQMEGSREVDHRADIYSLGVVFYEMLTRELPLGRFAPPSHKVQMDVRLDDVVLRSLEKEPARRYQHASEVKSDVEHISQSAVAPLPLDQIGQPSPRAMLPAEEYAAARAQVRGPAIGLLVTGIIHCLASALILLSGLGWFTIGFPPESRPAGGSIQSTLIRSPMPIAGMDDPTQASSSAPPILLSPQGLPGSTSAGWILGQNGPALNEEFARTVLGLQPGQVEKVNSALQEVYQEFLPIEQQHIERHTDEAGHVVVKIKQFPSAIARLQDRLWSQLDAILTTEQQSTARLNLKLDQPKVVPGATMSDLLGPGFFFGWGEHGVQIELWKVGTWYHWSVTSRGYGDSSRGPQLPAAYRRFWKEPATSSPLQPEADAQPERKD